MILIKQMSYNKGSIPEYLPWLLAHSEQVWGYEKLLMTPRQANIVA
jgi:hypothetical protein